VQQLKRGILVAIEGIDGAGKTTQTSILADKLNEQGYDSTILKEPTDGKWGQKIRRLALENRDLSPEEECQLFLADRMEDVEKNISPALRMNKIVIMDRYFYSNMAYQGALGLDMKRIREANESFAPIPEIVIILDVAPKIGQSRLVNGRRETPNNFEKLEYLEKVRSKFDEMANFKNVQKVDGSRPIEDVAAEIINIVSSIRKSIGEVNGSEMVRSSSDIIKT